MKIQFTDDAEEFYMYSLSSSRFYAQDTKDKAPVQPQNEKYEPSDKKRIKSKDDYKVQRSMKRGEQ